MSYIRVGIRAGVLMLLISSSAAMAADPQGYMASLDPVSRSNITQMLAVGRGAATASLQGNKLTIQGNFAGLASAATDAHLCIGIGIGTPGSCDVADLTVSKDTNGAVSGTVALNSKQMAALPAGQLYIQVNSVKAPAPDGNLWGWLLFAHETVGPDIPQEGHWFLPQYDMPKSAEHGSTHPLSTDSNS